MQVLRPLPRAAEAYVRRTNELWKQFFQSLRKTEQTNLIEQVQKGNVKSEALRAQNDALRLQVSQANDLLTELKALISQSINNGVQSPPVSVTEALREGASITLEIDSIYEYSVPVTVPGGGVDTLHSQGADPLVLDANSPFRVHDTVLRNGAVNYLVGFHLKNTNSDVPYLGWQTRVLDPDPREAFRMAIYKLAVQVIMVHNHPGGNVTPSWEDQDLTDHFIQAGKFLKIEVIDHLIISEETYYSFVDSGIFKKLQASEKWVLPYRLKDRYRDEGKKEGLEEGEKRGKEEKAIEIAKALKQKEINMTIIAETSGLSIEEIKKL